MSFALIEVFPVVTNQPRISRGPEGIFDPHLAALLLLSCSIRRINQREAEASEAELTTPMPPRSCRRGAT